MDRFQVKSSRLLKELFRSASKIKVLSGKYASLPGRPRREGETQAMSKSCLSSQEVSLYVKQNQNTENKTGYNIHLGSELSAQDLAFV